MTDECFTEEEDRNFSHFLNQLSYNGKEELSSTLKPLPSAPACEDKSVFSQSSYFFPNAWQAGMHIYLFADEMSNLSLSNNYTLFIILIIGPLTL